MTDDWYPSRKCSPSPDLPAFVDLDLFESDQVQERWIVEGTCGLDLITWRDGKFAFWWPVCGGMERARAILG